MSSVIGGAPSDGRLPTIASLTDSAFQVQPLNGGQQRRKEVRADDVVVTAIDFGRDRIGNCQQVFGLAIDVEGDNQAVGGHHVPGAVNVIGFPL